MGDRIIELQQTDTSFTLPKTFSAEKYYANTIGIYVNDELRPQKVRIRVYGNQVEYLRTLPLHRSQKEVLTKHEQFSEFQYRVCLTPELFTQQKSLTLEELHDLIERVKQGRQEAGEKLKSVYMPFVYSIAKQYLNKGLSENELLKAGTDGLVKAAHSYDPSRRYKFIAYVVWWVRQSILSVIEDGGKQ